MMEVEFEPRQSGVKEIYLTCSAEKCVYVKMLGELKDLFQMFIKNSVHKYLLTSHYVPSSVLGTEDPRRTEEVPSLTS